jgi:hypothetical protein
MVGLLGLVEALVGCFRRQIKTKAFGR